MTARSILVPLALALVGGVIGSAATLAWSAPDNDKKTTDIEVEGADPVADTDNPPLPPFGAERSDEVEQLSAQLRSLERRVSLLTLALGRARANPGATGADAVGDGQDEPGTAPAADVADPVFEAAVRDILDRVGEERDQERQDRRTQLRQEIATRWSDELASELGLTPAQKTKVAELVQGYFDAMREMRDMPPEERPVTRREWREKMRAVRSQSEAQLAEILSPGQLQKYEQLDDGDKLGGAFRGGRGRGRSGDR